MFNVKLGTFQEAPCEAFMTSIRKEAHDGVLVQLDFSLKGSALVIDQKLAIVAF